MFVSKEWTNSDYASSKNEGEQVLNIALSDDRFWKSIEYCLKCVIPLVKVLRLVHGNTKAMSYIYIYIYTYIYIYIYVCVYVCV